MAKLQSRTTLSDPPTMDEVLARRRESGRFTFWASWELASFLRGDPQVWMTACCPRAARDCPAVVDEDDELVCPRCRGTR